jgi:hypothetical protein
MRSDTHPEIEKLHLALWRQAPTWRKVHMLGEMYQTMKQLALVGLRARYPEASQAELRRRLADLLLGADLANQVYGPLVPEGNPHAD